MRRPLALLLLSCVLSSAMPNSASSVEIFAHRGASADAPENSLSAMKLAWEQGADAVEFDLWLSKDGKILVFHDADTKRIGGVPRKISDYTLAEASQIDVGSWKHGRFAGEKMPSLEAILATVPRGKKAIIEMKCGPEIAPELARVLTETNFPNEQTVIISFHDEALVATRQLLPNVAHFLLADYKRDAATGAFPELAPLVQKAKAAGFQGLNLNHQWPMDAKVVGEMRAQGLTTLVWTVNELEIAKRWATAGAEGITTDRPGWLKEQLKSWKP